MKMARWMAAALLSAAAVFAVGKAVPGPVDDEIKEAERRVNAAYEANDLPKYFSFYAQDFSQFLPEGRTDLATYRKDWEAYIAEGNRVEKVEISDLQVQAGPGNDTAVASYLLHVRTKLKDGKITEEDNQESDVWFRRNGEWRIVFLHYSAAPRK
jgi:ketosteroid isomerase-like protein